MGSDRQIEIEAELHARIVAGLLRLGELRFGDPLQPGVEAQAVRLGDGEIAHGRCRKIAILVRPFRPVGTVDLRQGLVNGEALQFRSACGTPRIEGRITSLRTELRISTAQRLLPAGNRFRVFDQLTAVGRPLRAGLDVERIEAAAT